MALGMARPQKHPRTGVYWYRRRVPDRLRAAVGKTEEVRSLHTKDPAVARERFAAVAAEIDERWRNLARGPVALSHEQVHALAGELYRAEVEANRANPGSAQHWASAQFFAEFFAHARQREGTKPNGLRLTTGWSPAEAMAKGRYGDLVDALLAKHGLQVRPEDRKRIVLAAVDAMRDAHGQLQRNAEGDYRPDPQAERFPPLKRPGRPLTMQALWDDYKDLKKPSPSTVKRWEPVLHKMAAFVDAADVRDITEDDLICWRDHLVKTSKLDPKTVKGVYIAAVSAVFRWGKGQGKLKVNPAAEIEVTVPGKDEVREKGFKDWEARTILSATLAPPSPPSPPSPLSTPRRWVPWLCAYTGARVNEITQLRGQDVYQGSLVQKENGCEVEVPYYFIKITPEAGRVKNRRFREVPLHDHLVE
ncbi:DUF6538 domain-containing protein [Microvirga sp. VF16]|uniref:DUF6538 domain-containing protein n=1 Tax=Microvirga sp. VF16 TaxID=2807101 RepID=UPI00193D7052|nr:DUF6538 domain-containing protein [Microvirga sp. VF16]QRM36046.1 integrase [Microvirga sp. VF16]